MQTIFSSASSVPFLYAPLPDAGYEGESSRADKRQRPHHRRAIILLGVTGILVVFFLCLSYTYTTSSTLTCSSTTQLSSNPVKGATSASATSSVQQADQSFVSYDKSSAPGIGCEATVSNLQQRIIAIYREELKGVRYANMWGYLDTENKGDAAIWAAQNMLLGVLGITPMASCRYLDRGCDVDQFKARLEEHAGRSAIIMAGGGNFNDFWWDDQPARIKMIDAFHKYPVRAFPQSVYMTKPDRIQQTVTSFTAHPNLQLAARDQPSFEWLQTTFNHTQAAQTHAVRSILSPDIAFMWGNRPDLRTQVQPSDDVLFLLRDDQETIVTDVQQMIPHKAGFLSLAGLAANVSYRRVDWNSLKTPSVEDEGSRDQVAWHKAMHGFRILASARFLVTDRLHGHILATILGIPHVLIDSKLGKNLAFHDTWTRDCNCVRVATSIAEASQFIAMYFAPRP